MKKKILVIGSMNMDLVVEAERYPKEGETLTGKHLSQIPGGKGANQAAAIGKLGGNVSFISACGNDQYADILLASLKESGVDTEDVFRVKENTGVALITVDSKGNNRIIVVQGANASLSPKRIDKIEQRVKEADYLLIQMELPFATVLHSIELAHKYDTKIILDPAPARPLPLDILNKIDYLLPNEGELKQILPDYESEDEIINTLFETGLKNLLLTKGEKGVSHYKADYRKDYKAIKVKAVDTTAAGDAFAGAFTTALAKGWGKEDAILFAIKAAAISVTRLGAQSSLPELAEVEDFKG